MKNLVNRLIGESSRIRTIQDSHHQNTLGFPDADDIQENLWKDLTKLLHEAFVLIADFRAFQGDHRNYTYK
jgi:hypothetical protein